MRLFDINEELYVTTFTITASLSFINFYLKQYRIFLELYACF